MLNRLLEQFDGDEDFARHMITMFAEQLVRIEAALGEAAQSQASKQIVALTHELKGMALNLGFDPLAHQAADIEESARAGQINPAAVAGLVDAIKTQIQQIKTFMGAPQA